jgi:hypothetical protein
LKVLGKINNRQILYCNIRIDNNWVSQLPQKNWIAFTIADNEDKDLLNEITFKCLDNGVCYTCSTGQLGSDTEDYFDQEIAWRETQKEEKTGEPADFDKTPMTSFHKSLKEGFWFATTVAYATINDEYLETNEVVCIDFTKHKVENEIAILIDQINNGWLPSDEDIESS